MQTAAVVEQASQSHTQRSVQETTEDDGPESTGETEEDYRNPRARKATQENGLPADVIGKAIPVQHGDRLGDIIMQRHLLFNTSRESMVEIRTMIPV
jgi:hypothetical protein